MLFIVQSCHSLVRLLAHAVLFNHIPSILQIWLSFAPIADHTAHFYNTIPDTVNYLSLVYMVVSAVFGAGSAYLLDKLGLRTGVSLHGLDILSKISRKFSQ